MKLGIIGRGRWGDVYAKTLTEMGIEYRQMGRDWTSSGLDGVIIASKAESHYQVAKSLIIGRMPCLIEKPVCMNLDRASRLMAWAKEYDAIVFSSHTRLYSPGWREFKASLPEAHKVEAWAGGECKTDPHWDWGSHLVAMCLDIGFPPDKASLVYGNIKRPLTFTVNDQFVFQDGITDPMPLNVLIQEFVEAIEKGERNIEGLKMGVEVTRYLDGA